MWVSQDPFKHAPNKQFNDAPEYSELTMLVVFKTASKGELPNQSK